MKTRTFTCRRWLPGLAAILLLTAQFSAAPFRSAPVAVAPTLGGAQSFAVLGASTVTNVVSLGTLVTGNLGVSPALAVTGFPPGVVILGGIHANDALAIGAQADAQIAYNALVPLAQPACTTVVGDLGGLTLTPGVYCFPSSGPSAQLTGALTLDAEGDSNAVWVFQIMSTLTTASASSVNLINGAQQCHVFWQVGSSATLGTTTTFVGTIIAQASITMNTGASLAGRALALVGAVTLSANAVSLPACSIPPAGPIPPALAKDFAPATMTAGGVSTLTINLSNTDLAAATLSAPLVDTLPSGVVIAASPNASTTCAAPSALVAVAGASTVTLNSGVIPGNGACTITVNVTAPLAGAYTNGLAAGALITGNGNNANAVLATLTVSPVPGDVPQPPLLGKTFSPSTSAAGAVSTVTITLTNPNLGPANLTANLVDTLPSGVVIAPVPNASTTCALNSFLAAMAGASTVTLDYHGATIPGAGSCTITVDVIAPVVGTYNNVLAAGALLTTFGINANPAAASVTVIPPASIPPTLGKAFSPATITAGGISTLTITLTNPNGTIATLTSALIDHLPNGVVIASTPNVATTCGIGPNGAPTAVAGSSTVTLKAGSTIPAIAAGGSCTVTVDVTASCTGSYCNTLPARALQTNKGKNARLAQATLTVREGPKAPKLSKSFSPATIKTGGTSLLTITLSNLNSTAATLTAPLVDLLPSGMVIALVPNAATTCGAGIPVAIAGGSTVTLPAASTIPAAGCKVTVSVTSLTKGSYCNTLPAGALKTNVGNNAGAAQATLTVNNHTGGDRCLGSYGVHHAADGCDTHSPAHVQGMKK